MATSPVHGRQFRDVFSDLIIVRNNAIDLPNAAVGSGTFASLNVTVTGAALGDFVMVSLGVALPDGAAIVGSVTAANVVTLTLLNNTAGAVDLASTVARILVLRANTSAFIA